MNKREIAQRILAVLQRNTFANWYGPGGRFDEWISDDISAPSENEILEDIERMFNL